MMEDITLGDLIKEHIEHNGWTLEKLSRKSGLNISYLSWLIRGKNKSKPKIEKLQVIAKALKVPEKRLFNLAGYNVSEPKTIFKVKQKSIEDLMTDLIKKRYPDFKITPEILITAINLFNETLDFHLKHLLEKLEV